MSLKKKFEKIIKFVINTEDRLLERKEGEYME